MDLPGKTRKIMPFLLWLICIHSAVVGLSLIFLPATSLTFFGYNTITERFFPVQGGVFHLVMAIVYGMAAFDGNRFRALILVTIIAKFAATVFLLSYYLFVDPIVMVVLSAVSDFLMGILVLIGYRISAKKE